MRLLILALVGLFLSCKPNAVHHAQPYDEEFLYWCEKDGRWPVYVEEPEECTSVSRGEWDHLPIIVNAEASLEDETMKAIESFNSQVGFELFRFQTLNMDPDIVVVELPDLWYAAAEARHHTQDGKHKGMVVVRPDIAAMDRDDIMLHELGHMVGLMHDPDNLGSMMYPGPSIRARAVEYKDIVALRWRYRNLRR